MMETIEKIFKRIDQLRLMHRDEILEQEFSALVQQLVDQGVYVEEKYAKKVGAKKMVESWGANWHKYKGILKCPKCQSNLCDEVNGPPFKLEIGQYNLDTDSTDSYACPKCNHTWSKEASWPNEEVRQANLSKIEKMSKKLRRKVQ